MSDIFLAFSFGGMLSYVFYILVALVVLMIMITIHEFGHFIAGKLLGFKINEFAIGFGKALWSKKTKDGIDVSVRLIPLGGYCAFDGEDLDSSDPRAFNNQKPWKRLIVLFMGPFFNFLSAILFSFVLLMTAGYSDLVQITKVDQHSPNYSVIQEGDIIYAVDGVETNFVNDKYFITMIQDYNVGDEVTLTIKRDGEFIDVTIQKGFVVSSEIIESQYVYDIDGKSYIIDNTNGFKLVNVNDPTDFSSMSVIVNSTASYAFVVNGMSYIYDTTTNTISCQSIGINLKNYTYNFGEALVNCVPFTVEWGWKVLVLLWQLITGQLALSGIGGPITTIGTIASQTQANWLNLLILFPLLSVNLAVFNLIPFPALDGARMVFVIIEWIRRKPIDRKIEGYIHTAGLMFLFAFVIFVDFFNLLT